MIPREWRWPIGIVATLLLTVGANVAIAIAANDDPSMTAESDYYQKAIRFDATQALRRRGERLGWALTTDAGIRGTNGSSLSLTLRDRAGVPITDATVRITARHVARASRAVTGVLPWRDDAYVGALALDRDGLWDLEIDVIRGTDHLVETRRIELGRAPR
ncbi:MAG: FixH family protein [Gemmatimonadaceae bacterium]|nr:FixH family protein [Gemmatimonadaceae bacterium]